MNPSSTASYSYQWALSIVESLAKTYPRATEVTCEILDITPKTIAYYLAKRDPLYPQLRELIHRVDKMVKFASPPMSMSEICYFMSKYSCKFQPERITKRLTAILNGPKFKEQLMKGGNCEASADQLPSFVFSLPKVVDDGYGPQLCFQFADPPSQSTQDRQDI
jgi:hypothetical protein